MYNLKKRYKNIVLALGLTMVMFFSSIFSQTVYANEVKKEISGAKRDIVSIEGIEDTVSDSEDVNLLELNEKKVTKQIATKAIDIEDKKNTKEQIINEKGQEYIIKKYEKDEKKYVTAYSQDQSLISVICVDGEIVTSKVYSYDPECQEYIEQTMVLDIDQQKLSENTVSAQKIKYNSKTSCKWPGKPSYYYQTGTSGKKIYLKIGCKANYRIRIDNLSSSKSKKCTSYKTAVKKSKSNYSKGIAYLAGTDISLGVVLGLIVANATFPPSVIVSIVVGTIGGGATVYKAVNCLVTAYEKYQDAKDYYAIIKTYGTKL